MCSELPQRKSTRLKDFDYNTNGAYFITICTEGRGKILSSAVGGDVLDAPHIELLPHGKIADKYIRQINDHYADIVVDRYVIMPDHIHIILFLFDNGASSEAMSSPPTTLYLFTLL